MLKIKVNLVMQSVLKDKHYSVEDYFSLEESGEVRHEFLTKTFMK